MLALRNRFSSGAGEDGFTLLELLVALSIFSLAALAIVRVQAMAVRTSGELRSRELASIVLQNRMVESMTQPAGQSLGNASGTEQNGGVSWAWTEAASLTADPNVVQVQIAVSGPGLRRPMTVRFVKWSGAQGGAL